MSCNNGHIIYSKANPACCPTPEVIINETCENLINIPSTAVTVFNTSNNSGVYAAFTFILDNNSTSNANFTVVSEGLPNTTIVTPGSSVTRVFKNVTSVSVAATDMGETIDGRLCIKIYNRIFLI